MARSQAEQVAGVHVFSSQKGAETIPRDWVVFLWGATSPLFRHWPKIARNWFRARPIWLPADAAPLQKSAHYRSGTRKIVASGGTTRLTSGTAPSSNVVTAPAFPRLLPPYSAESLLRISRQVPENGTLMR